MKAYVINTLNDGYLGLDIDGFCFGHPLKYSYYSFDFDEIKELWETIVEEDTAHRLKAYIEEIEITIVSKGEATYENI